LAVAGELSECPSGVGVKRKKAQRSRQANQAYNLLIYAYHTHS